MGFAEVWFQASSLNRYVMEVLHKAEVQSIALSPCSSVIASDGRASVWETTPIRMALSSGIVPVIFGDVVFDEIRGGTILSTEDLFMQLARALTPERILLAGLEAAVWADFPARAQKIERITPNSFEEVSAGVGKSAGADVTGGMESKVKQMLELVREVPGMTIQIFSGEEPGNILKALSGETLGTLITM
jgi:isopentenyl phosphate kinase